MLEKIGLDDNISLSHETKLSYPYLRWINNPPKVSAATREKGVLNPLPPAPLSIWEAPL